MNKISSPLQYFNPDGGSGGGGVSCPRTFTGKQESQGVDAPRETQISNKDNPSRK